MTTKSKWVPAIACACCLVFSVSIQRPLAAQKQHATVRVTTRLVEVNVVAQDKKGAAITDLTRDDFEVSEQGKPQALSVFLLELRARFVVAGHPRLYRQF
jgi:Ca-activated chloride channel family protein